MPMKEILYKLQPMQLYVILTLSICYFILQLILSQLTHALTLLIASYHMLCNIVSLFGCILTIKHSKRWREENISKEALPVEEACFVEVNNDKSSACHRHETKLRNTFGWTRIDILTMLIVCTFLASFSFSLLVEALQTLIHIDHQDTMHLPLAVFSIGAVGLVLNGICYLMIGGYTMHQGSFLHITSAGNVVLDHVGSANDLKATERRLSNKTNRVNNNLDHIHNEPAKRQGLGELFRDVCSTVFVMICSAIIYFADDEQVTKFIDPIFSMLSCFVLGVLSYPYMKESCLILLQTIPGTIDIEQFKTTLLSKFSDIVSVHDLHIWQLTASKYVSTAHIIFRDPTIYSQIMEDVINFFHEQGITNVTIEPEFKTNQPLKGSCHWQCKDVACLEKHCCPIPQIKPTIVVVPNAESECSLKPPVNDDVKPIEAEKCKSTLHLNELNPVNTLRKYASDSQLTNVTTLITAIDSKPIKTDKDNKDETNNFELRIEEPLATSVNS